MNASTIIRFFISEKILSLSKKKVIKLTKQIGSDVQLGLNYKNKILFSNGKIKEILRKKAFFVIIIKPNYGCSTKKIYDGIKKYSMKKLKIGKKNYFTLKNLIKLQNDLEKVVFKYYPKLIKVKYFMEGLPNIEFARMTGSGSSIVAYFLSKNSAINAAKLFKKKYKNYWCITSKTI